MITKACDHYLKSAIKRLKTEKDQMLRNGLWDTIRRELHFKNALKNLEEGKEILEHLFSCAFDGSCSNYGYCTGCPRRKDGTLIKRKKDAKTLHT